MLELDVNTAVRGRSDCGVREEDLDALAPEVERCLRGLRAGGPWTGWVGLPGDTHMAERCLEYAAGLGDGVRDVVVMGIGGSSLGPLALWQAALHPACVLPDAPRAPQRRLHFLDNSDPDTVTGVLESLDPARTQHVVITKSGSTAETGSQLMIAWQRAARALGGRARDRFVFVTDPEKGDLRALAGRLGVTCFSVPPDVGGRFSVLGAVGLLPAALAGIDPGRVLAGARAMRGPCLEAPLRRNPAALLAAVAHLLERNEGRRVHVIMPYSDRLAALGQWFRQLWAESLGKRGHDGRGVGPTPLDARGATDQHSLLQLLVDGPPDKFVIFVEPRERRHAPVPALFSDLGSFGYLGGTTLHELIAAERRGTEMSLARAGTPSVTIGIDEVSPASAGALFYLFEVATAVAGHLMGIDPYDQPGVEEGKKLASAMLGRAGYEDRLREVEAFESGRREDLVVEI